MRAAYDADTTQAFGELAYTADFDAVRVEPFINLAHVRARSERFGESGSDASLVARPGRMSTTVMTAGPRIESTHVLKGKTVRTSGMVGWQRLFGDTKPVLSQGFSTADAFTIAGAPLARDSLSVEGGVELSLGRSAALGVHYAGRFARNTQDHAVAAGLRVRF